jgi:hypothetical protein
MANHCTADFPNPVGMTIMVEPDKAVRNASSWYALASTPPLRRGWATEGMRVHLRRRMIKVVSRW